MDELLMLLITLVIFSIFGAIILYINLVIRKRWLDNDKTIRILGMWNFNEKGDIIDNDLKIGRVVVLLYHPHCPYSERLMYDKNSIFLKAAREEKYRGADVKYAVQEYSGMNTYPYLITKYPSLVAFNNGSYVKTSREEDLFSSLNIKFFGMYNDLV